MTAKDTETHATPEQSSGRPAVDLAALHAGNFGLTIDHEKVAARVETLLADMSVAEQLAEIRGLQPQPVEGLYHAGGNERLGIGTWRMVDGPRGARTGTATAFPVAIARAATFDPMLEREVGLAIGKEVAARGGNVLLAPTINLLRHPGWGRAQETYSEDPWHMGLMGAAFVSGTQNHVLASPKHFALNNLENTRFDMSADIDERTLQELYLPHFRRCVVEAAAASIMSAYNKVNGVYCGEHEHLLTHILRDQWGFRGFVESDWFLGARSTGPALAAGLDIEMPAAYRYTDDNVQAAIAEGEIDAATITARARATLHQKVAWLDGDRTAGLAAPDESVVECADHVTLARTVAERSTVLLRNEGGVLPLATESASVALLGEFADKANLGDRGSSMVTPSEVITPWQGVSARLPDATLLEVDASDATLAGFDTVIVVAGLCYRDEGEFIPTAQQEAEGTDLARGGDRQNLRLPEVQEQLIARVAANARHTIVVLQGGSSIIVEPWIEQVDAVLMTWYPGQQGGHALANVLLGDVDPGGRMPVTLPRTMTQLPPWDTQSLAVKHDLLHGYRWLHHHAEQARYPFGFGLSYSRFEYADLDVSRGTDGFAVSVTVSNSGERAGIAVPQLYVSHTNSAVFRAPRELKGFCSLLLEPGTSQRVCFTVSEEDLAYWDVGTSAFVYEGQPVQFHVAESADHLVLSSEPRD